MNTINDGGAAFPVPEPGLETGMTLRDYFAAQALPAIISTYVEANGRCIGTDHFPRNVPILAYQLADAMLKARGA